MTPVACDREADVLDAVLGRAFGAAAGTGEAPRLIESLEEHLLRCHDCREVALIADALRHGQDRTHHDVPVPAAGQVWWRAAVRARLEVTHAAERPLTWAHGAAAAAGIGLVAGTAGMAWPAIERVFATVAERLSSLTLEAPDMANLLTAAVSRGATISVALAFLVLAPLVFYLALADE